MNFGIGDDPAERRRKQLEYKRELDEQIRAKGGATNKRVTFGGRDERTIPPQDNFNSRIPDREPNWEIHDRSNLQPPGAYPNDNFDRQPMGNYNDRNAPPMQQSRPPMNNFGGPPQGMYPPPREEYGSRPPMNHHNDDFRRYDGPPSTYGHQSSPVRDNRSGYGPPIGGYQPPPGDRFGPPPGDRFGAPTGGGFDRRDIGPPSPAIRMELGPKSSLLDNLPPSYPPHSDNHNNGMNNGSPIRGNRNTSNNDNKDNNFAIGAHENEIQRRKREQREEMQRALKAQMDEKEAKKRREKEKEEEEERKWEERERRQREIDEKRRLEEEAKKKKDEADKEQDRIDAQRLNREEKERLEKENSEKSKRAQLQKQKELDEFEKERQAENDRLNARLAAGKQKQEEENRPKSPPLPTMAFNKNDERPLPTLSNKNKLPSARMPSPPPDRSNISPPSGPDRSNISLPPSSIGGPPLLSGLANKPPSPEPEPCIIPPPQTEPPTELALPPMKEFRVIPPPSNQVLSSRSSHHSNYSNNMMTSQDLMSQAPLNAETEMINVSQIDPFSKFPKNLARPSTAALRHEEPLSGCSSWVNAPGNDIIHEEEEYYNEEFENHDFGPSGNNNFRFLAEDYDGNYPSNRNMKKGDKISEAEMEEELANVLGHNVFGDDRSFNKNNLIKNFSSTFGELEDDPINQPLFPEKQRRKQIKWGSSSNKSSNPDRLAQEDIEFRNLTEFVKEQALNHQMTLKSNPGRADDYIQRASVDEIRAKNQRRMEAADMLKSLDLSKSTDVDQRAAMRQYFEKAEGSSISTNNRNNNTNENNNNNKYDPDLEGLSDDELDDLNSTIQLDNFSTELNNKSEFVRRPESRRTNRIKRKY
eukprot:TRINITY_DN9619_c0_g1_i1.p1 TRINITY_DN9619_c0_g1~~TRINITY_DN9619_c0_g1_i1.p1  ORF type:complete len:869 (-),score=270.81 TRINITY_DN9619_c0_g1_i1:198-2804(-)